MKSFSFIFLLFAWLISNSINLLGQSENDARKMGIKQSIVTLISSDSSQKKTITSKAFDKKGNVLEECTQSISRGIKECDRFEYSRKGLLLKENHFENDSLLFSISNEYNTSGRCIKRLKTLANGKSFLLETTNWNNWGDKTEEIQFDKNGKIKKKVTFVYNNRNLLQTRIIEDGSGKVIQEKTFQYEYR
jgi:antitoxin component YwqK of YwqJK toxin-antitoxin module